MGQRTFAFSTGGPSIVLSEPHEGSTFISEDQILILELDGEPVENTLLSNVSFIVEGISERAGIRIVSGEERESILKTHYEYRHELRAPVLLIQAKQRFPAGARVRLVWGKGVTARSGIGNVSR